MHIPTTSRQHHGLRRCSWRSLVNQCCNSHGRRGRKSHSCFLGEENVTCLCLDVHALQMFVTCYSSSSEQLQSPQLSVFICKFFLAVGVNREVDGGEWDVTQEAGFGSLKRRIKRGDTYYAYSVKWLQ